MPFEDFQNYSKDQQIITSDRVIINAKEDFIFLIAKIGIALSTGGNVHIDIGDPNNKKQSSQFILNAPVIQFGLAEHGDVQPIAKGGETTLVIDRILDALNKFSNTMQSAVGVGVGTVDLTLVRVAANALAQEISVIKKLVDNIKSKTTFSI